MNLTILRANSAKAFKRGWMAMLLFWIGLNLMAYINYGGQALYQLKSFIQESVMLAVFGLLLNEGLIYISRFFEKYFSQGYLTFKRVILEYLAVILFSLTLVTIIYLLPIIKFVLDFTINEQMFIWIRQVYIMIFILTTILFAFRKGYWSYRYLLKTSLDTEKLKKQRMNEQFEMFKNQVNPHFLFNSLSALSTLIYSNKGAALQFVEELSSVYRYILDSRGKNLIELKQELRFFESYAFLLRTRYRTSIEIILTIAEGGGFVSENFIPPLTTQIIIENAIKHNVHTRENPLKVLIEVKDGMLTGRNKLQLRKAEHGTKGAGITAQIEEFKYLSHQNLAFKVVDGEFCITVPLFKAEEK